MSLQSYLNEKLRGLYHAPKVSTAEFEQGWHNGRKDDLARFKFKPGTLHCESQRAECTCGDPGHVWYPRPGGWELEQEQPEPMEARI